jgi:hypothetical protein
MAIVLRGWSSEVGIRVISLYENNKRVGNSSYRQLESLNCGVGSQIPRLEAGRINKGAAFVVEQNTLHTKGRPFLFSAAGFNE